MHRIYVTGLDHTLFPSWNWETREGRRKVAALSLHVYDRPSALHVSGGTPDRHDKISSSLDVASKESPSQYCDFSLIISTVKSRERGHLFIEPRS